MNFNKNKLSRTPPYFSRSIIVPKIFIGKVKPEVAKFYNEEKREMKSLMKCMPSRMEMREQQLREQAARIQHRLDELWKKSRILTAGRREGLSFSQVAAIGAQPVAGLSLKPVERVERSDMTVRKARQDYTRAYNKMSKDREMFRQLAIAMARRHPKKIWVQKEHKELVRNNQLLEALRALRREKRYLSRHPAVEVKEFPLGCFYEQQREFAPKTVVNSCLKGVARALSIKQVKSRTPLSRYTTEKEIFNQKQVRKDGTRSILPEGWINFLKFKIRMRVLFFRDRERVIRFYDRILNSPVGQMDQTGEVQTTLADQEVKSNTAIVTSAVDEAKGISAEVMSGFKNLAISHQSQNFSTMTEKWVRLGTAKWNATQPINTEIASYNLPEQILTQLTNSQMAQLMYTNRLFRMDMRIKIVVNSSPWMVGMLIADWLYTGSNDDLNFLNNRYSAVQRNHVRISAGSSNNAELLIPFHHTKSFISAKKGENMIGRLTLRVFNPLNIIDRVATTVNVSVFVCFDNFEGHALVSRDIGYNDAMGQMNTIGSLCNTGSNLLRTAGNIFNQDKPPLPLQPLSLVPQTVQSFCYTDGLSEPINVLRSDPRGQRPPSMVASEMSLMSIARKWGFLKTIEWSFSSDINEPLSTIEVSPLLNTPDIPTYKQISPGIIAGVYPPVMFVTNLASKARGNLEYMFEVVANSFYTGSLQISTVPLDHSNVKRSKDQLIMSNTQIFDIQESTKFAVSVPWNYYTPWLQTPSVHNNYGEVFARIYVMVLNPLIAIAQVPTKIYINVYIRAGDNFEISQLHMPILALADTVPLLPPATEVLKPYNFEDKMYLTTSKRAVGTKDYLKVLYIQNVVDGWTGYTNVSYGKIYYVAKTSKGYDWRIPGFTLYATGLPSLSNSNAKGLVLFSSFQRAQSFIDSCVPDYTPEKIQKYLDRNPTEKWSANSDWSQIKKNQQWQTASNEDGDYPMWFITKVPLHEDFEIVGQMEQQPYTITTERLAPTTRFGMTVYGESMPDFKGIARRWQAHSTFSVGTCSEKFSKDCPPLAILKVQPRRPLEYNTSHNFDNRARDGSISLLNSCYGFWEGGMRYRIVVTSEIPEDSIIYVQHRFDKTGDKAKEAPPDNIRNVADMVDTHYPTFVQALSVNPVLTVELPYMRCEEKLRNISHDEPSYNGYLMIWVHSPKPSNIDLEIYYSVADDFQWSVFQGVPPMFDIRQLADEPQGQMDENALYFSEEILDYDLQPVRPKLEPFFSDKDQLAAQGIREGITKMKDSVVDLVSSSISSGVQKAAEKAAETAFANTTSPTDEIGMTIRDARSLMKSSETNIGKITESIDDVSKKLGSFVDKVSGIPSAFSDQQKARIKANPTSFFSELGMSTFDYATHLVYCVINPQGPTIAWALVNVYRTAWGFTLEGASKLIKPIAALWERATSATQQPQPTGQMEDSDISSICSVLYATMTSALKLCVRPPKDWTNIADGLFNFGNTARGANMVSVFMRDNVRLFKRIWSKIVSCFSCFSGQYRFISGIEDARLRNWCALSTAILNPSVREKILTNPLWAEKVFELAVTGRAIVLILSKDKATPTNLMRMINDNMVALRKLEEELVNRNVFCGERYEPFCLWACGDAGVGKTRAMQDVATALADELKIPCAQTYHTITMNQQYFDGYVGQPTVMIDDFLATSADTDPVVPMFCQMKTSALFNPPYSAVKDKCKLVNFYNLIVTSNFADVNNRPGIHDSSAYNRRRDLVLKYAYLPHSSAQTQWTLEQYQKGEHYVVSWALNPLDINCGWEVINRKPEEDYSKTVMDFILERARRYHAKESESFAKRCSDKIRRLEKFSNVLTIDDYLDKVTDCLSNNSDSDFWIKSNFFSYWRKPDVENLSPADMLLRGLNVKAEEKKSELLDPIQEIVKPPEELKGQMNDQPKIEEKENLADFGLDLKTLKKHFAPKTIECRRKEYRSLPFGVDKTMLNPSWPISLEFLMPEDCDELDVYPLDLFDKVEDGYVFEPYDRTVYPERENTKVCLHTLVKNPEKYIYDAKKGHYTVTSSHMDDYTKEAMGFPAGQCWFKHGKEIVRLPSCILADDKKLTKESIDFKNKMVNNWMANDPVAKVSFPDFTDQEIFKLETIYPDYVQTVVQITHRNQQPLKLLAENIRMDKNVQRMQKQLTDSVVIVGDNVIPKESKWKSIPKAIWNGFLNCCNVIEKVFWALLKIITFFTSGAILLDLGATLFTGTGIFPRLHPQPVGDIHPSGDFKTIKNSSKLRVNASKLGMKGQNLTDGEIIKACVKDPAISNSSGILNNIVKNVFTLVGIREEDDQQVIYRVRCIGLQEYKFLCIRHYIEHFEAMGVTKVAVVYYGGCGVFRCNLKDIKFEWGEVGYGVGIFPSLPKMFKNIIKYIPSENFDGNYPTSMQMVEVFQDEIKIHNLEMIRLTQDRLIPKNGEQSAWTISQGFSYKWGGAGRCGSFIFCPQMACPLVGVHTAGIGSTSGYGEILLRETFEEYTNSLDFVEPQMDVKPEGLDLPLPEGYVVGHLAPDKAVNMPKESRIIPSIISGVFPVKSEPAPLKYGDPRLPPGCDPLEEGIAKRCKKPSELPFLLAQFARADLTRMLKINVKPLRTLTSLTVSQAVEGLTLPGYESLEMSTSEGYPWVLDRPKGASNKSWLFNFKEDNNRKYLIGINPKLMNTLVLKDNLRMNSVVPATYYTACLKDARILKSKVNQPGKTRVFEMSPVDLTIAQRQSYMDFYVAYQTARMDAENTIGINPDGPEWTELVNRLTDFSPYILTADYSGYGPKLLMSIQSLAYDAQIDWYEHHQTDQMLPESYIDCARQRREVLKYEMLHPLTVIKDLVVRFAVGMPSGNAGTVIINSLCNSLYIRIMYQYLAKKFKPQYADMYWFNKFVRMFSNGDDLIMAVKEDIISWFNNESLIEGFAEFGIVMTDALKDGKIRPFCFIEEATYLKRGFKKHPVREGHWLAPLEKDSITDTANWIWKCVDPKSASLVNSEMSCRLAYTHGPLFYNEVVDKITKVWLEEGQNFQAPSWESLDMHVWENSEGPKFIL